MYLTFTTGSNKKLSFVDLEILVQMHALLRSMLIHHMHTQYSKCQSHIESSLKKILCPNPEPMHTPALFPRGGANKSALSPPTRSCVDPLPFILDNEDEKGKNRDDNGHYPFTLVLDLTCCWQFNTLFQVDKLKK